MGLVKYIKDGEVQIFRTQGDKICTAIEMGNTRIAYPTHEIMLAAGYELYTEQTLEPTPVAPYVPTIEELVERKVREKYSINQEFQVQRKRDTDNAAFEEYYAYVEECIAWAYAQPHRKEESV